MKFTVALSLPMAFALPFEEFEAKYHRVYRTPEERKHRYLQYEANMKYAKEHNLQGHSWTLGATPFADLSNDEFRGRYTGGLRLSRTADLPVVSCMSAGLELPASVDWVTKGAVTPVKNQGTCGSCWSFSTTGSIEGINFLKTGKLVSLSEQQLIDCSISYGNAACDGGEMTAAMEYVAKSNGLCSEAAYPYQDTYSSGDDDGTPAGSPDPGAGTCKAIGKNACTPVATISNYTLVPPNSDLELQAAVALQPISVGVEADSIDWQLYLGGVVNNTLCGVNVDHGVLAAGYGTDNRTHQDYWLVKNSWGWWWGEAGYIRLARGVSSPPQGMCGILSQPVAPIKDN